MCLSNWGETLKVQKVAQDTFANLSAFFRMELGGIKIIFMERGAKRRDVMGRGSRKFVDRYVEAVDKVHKFFLFDTLKERTAEV